MSTVGTKSDVQTHRECWNGVAGTNDNDIVIETTAIDQFNGFFVSCGAGNFDIEVHNGDAWLTSAPLSMADLGSTSLDPVLVGLPLRQYAFRGNWKYIRVRQNGAIALTGMRLRACLL